MTVTLAAGSVAPLIQRNAGSIPRPGAATAAGLACERRPRTRTGFELASLPASVAEGLARHEVDSRLAAARLAVVALVALVEELEQDSIAAPGFGIGTSRS